MKQIINERYRKERTKIIANETRTKRQLKVDMKINFHCTYIFAPVITEQKTCCSTTSIIEREREKKACFAGCVHQGTPVYVIHDWECITDGSNFTLQWHQHWRWQRFNKRIMGEEKRLKQEKMCWNIICAMLWRMVLRLYREVQWPYFNIGFQVFCLDCFLFYRIQTNRISRSDECIAFVLQRLRL